MREALEQYLADCRPPIRHEEIGRMVSEAFRDVRAELQREIRAQMSNVSEFPRTSSGTMPAANRLIMGLATEPASVSGINANPMGSPNSSGLHSGATGTGAMLIAERPSRNVWVTSAVVAAIAGVSVAVIFTLVERVRTASAPPPPVPMATALEPAATQAPPPQPTAETKERTRAPEPAIDEPAVPPAATRPVQAPTVWRYARPQPAEPRSAPPLRSAAPSAAASVSAPSTSTAPASAAAEVSPARPPSPQPTAAPSTPNPAPTPTPQEGRKFRISL